MDGWVRRPARPAYGLGWLSGPMRRLVYPVTSVVAATLIVAMPSAASGRWRCRMRLIWLP